ncbi:sulfatase family protein [Diplocloster agilis]|uniref:Sulfatase-like hydrolase/transferase n=1 Tax=Diplocloster agilis TaxID=2850323 RepID=A0A949K5Q1_9FIRM|nr:sulfatase-like hydrolase/transferase [Diplocloster agilis]MBU9737706.1 sulfatase-like hydrolase/transferase [Diplocloster agilis]
MDKYNILYLMCDQFRYDCIQALGNDTIQTPNLDRLAARGVAFTEAYSTCPVCVAARYTVMTGCEPEKTGCYSNENPVPMDGQPEAIEERCGSYLARCLTDQGYRTFGIGKFHTKPDCYEDLGFEVHKHTEELWETPEIKEKDAYAGFMLREHPEYAHIDQLHGERTNMYYVPQMSPFPQELTVEAFTADLAVREIEKEDKRPYFGFVSFVGPHPPCAPPAPYHLMYNPDRMPNPIRGDKNIDLMDEQITFMNYAIWADEINDAWARNLRSRYYGEISYIDACIGRILDAVERRPDADRTLICFFSDHGDQMGDHRAWQKETFFEASAKIPFLLSMPGVLPQGAVDDSLIELADLYPIALRAAGLMETKEQKVRPEELRNDLHSGKRTEELMKKKDGVDILGGEKREAVVGVYGRPGTERFKVMIREGRYKYIFLSNGGLEQLFDLREDPEEYENLISIRTRDADEFRMKLKEICSRPGLKQSMENGEMKTFPLTYRPLMRIHQFEFSKNIRDFKVSKDNYFCSM